MAEGTSVGKGYVEIVGDFSPLHRQLEQFRAVWRRQVSGLGLSFDRALRPSVAGATRDLNNTSRASSVLGKTLHATDRDAKAASRSVGVLGDATRRLGVEMEGTRKRVQTADGGLRPFVAGVGDASLALGLLQKRLRHGVLGPDDKRSERGIAVAGSLAESLGARLGDVNRELGVVRGRLKGMASPPGLNELAVDLSRVGGGADDASRRVDLLRQSLRDLAPSLRAAQRGVLLPDLLRRRGMGDLAGMFEDAEYLKARKQVDVLRVDTDRLDKSIRALRLHASRLPGTLAAAGMPDLAREMRKVTDGAAGIGRASEDAGHRAQSGFRRGLSALRDWSRSTTRARGDALRLERAQIGLRMAVDRHGEGSLQARDAQLRLAQAQHDSARSGGLLARTFTSLGARTTIVNQRFQLLRNAMHVLKWPAIITGAALAAQALSALAAAAVAVVSAVGPAVGVLGALPGALAAAAQGFGVFRLATMGVADAFKEQLRNQSAVAAAAGQAQSSARAMEAAERAQADATRRLADAKVAVRDAEEDLIVARRDAGRAIADQRRAVVEATVSERRATLELRDARAALHALQSAADDLDLADARDRTADATRSITDAEREYQETVERTNAILADPRASERDRARARYDLADAEDRVGDARRALQRSTRDLDQLERGPRRRDLAQARLDVRDAEVRLADAQVNRKRSTAELHDLEERGIGRAKQVVQAERALRDAHQGVADAQQAVTDAARAMGDAQSDAGASTAKLNEELDKLPRSAQGFVRTLLDLKPRFDELRTVASDAFFPGARSGLLSAMRSFGPVRRVVEQTARALGWFAEAAGRLVGGKGFGRDLALIGGRNANVLRRVGRATVVTADALRHLMVAAGPLVAWLSNVTLGWARSWRESAKAGRESGRLARFFERTRAVLERLGSITGNVARAFRGIGRAAAPLGNAILAGLDRASERWARWTHSVRGQRELRRYFDDARPAIWELGRLLRDITNAFFRLGSQPGVARLLRQVRTELLPALERLMRVLQQTFAPAMVSALTSVVQLFSQLAGAGGILSSVLKMVDGIASGFTWMLRTIPGFRSLVFTFIALGGALGAIRVLGVITGFTKLARGIARVALAYRALRAGASAASIVASSGVAATGAARVAASSRLAALFSATGMMSAAGGKAAVGRAGATVGATMGAGVASGAAGAVAGAGRRGGAGVVASLGRSIAGAVGKGGLLAVGYFAADALISSIGDRISERSDDLLTRLGGFEGRSFAERGTKGPFSTGGITGAAGFGLNVATSLFRGDKESEAGKRLADVYREMLTSKVRMSRAEIDSLAASARSLDLTRAQRAEVDRMIALLRRGSRLRLGVDLNMGQATRRIENAFRLLRSGALTNFGDILRVSRRNMRLIAETLGTRTEEGRRAAARNMRLTADAVATAMRRAGVRTREGVELIEDLLRRADLISPTRKIARDFGREWARGMDSSKEITRRGLARMIEEARKMPGPMRDAALRAWVGHLDVARRNRRITEREYADLVSAVASEWTSFRGASRRTADAVSTSFVNLTNSAADAKSILIGNTSKALLALGGTRPLEYKPEKIKQKEQKKQRGGSIVPGTGSGDTFHTALPPGSFILNRNATRAYGFNTGGMVPVALEPRERVFLPDEVRQIGLGTLQRMNESVPRFGTRRERHQRGGLAGRPFNVDGARPGFVPLMNYLNSLFGPIYVMSGSRPGSITTTGNVSNHASGRAVDISTTENGLNFVTAPTEAIGNANLNATGAAARRMDALFAFMGRHIPTSLVPGDFFWRTLTGGNHFNHIHRGITNHLADSVEAMVAFLSTLPKSAGFGSLENVALAGPDGPLKQLGQAAINRVHRAANRYISEQAAFPTFGTGTIERVPHGGGATVAGRVSVFGPPTEPAETTASGGSSTEPGLALNMQPGTDSGWNNPTTDSWVRDRTRFLVTIGSHRAVLPVVDKGPAGFTNRAIDVTGAGSFLMGINPLRFPTDAFGTAVRVAQQGGLILSGLFQRFQKGSRKPLALPTTIEGGVNRIARILRKPLDRRSTRALISSTLRLIDGIGVPLDLQSDLTRLSNDTNLHAEMASRAGSLSYEMLYGERTPALNPDGSPILDRSGKPTFHEPGDPILDEERRPMTHFAEVGGNTEEGWTQTRLGALGVLRNKLVEAKDKLLGEQGRVSGLIDHTQRRIAEVKEAIRRANVERRRLRREIAALNRRIEKQRRKLGRERGKLTKLEQHPRRNRAAIEAAKNRIGALRAEIMGDVATRDGLEDQVGAIDGEQRRRSRVQADLQSVLGNADDGTGLLGRQRSMEDYLPQLLGSSSDPFKGLVTVQGLGGPETILPDLPPVGVLGGEIFDAQQILRQLGVKPYPIPQHDDTDGDGDGDDSERISLLEQLLRESSQRYAVSQAQYRVLGDFDRMPPFGGSFATGGWVPGRVGEARTIVAHGGERVLSVAEQQSGSPIVVNLIVERGAGVDENKIRVVAEGAVSNALRQVARVGGRRMPGLVGAGR